MSYVRWSSKVRQGCKACNDSGYQSGKLCRACTSCWYVYDDEAGHITAHHGGCTGPGGGESYAIDYDGARAWQPPADCPMRDIALEAVTMAADDHDEDERN